MSITVALYSHDSVGLGHARRNRALAYALAADLPRITGQHVRGLLIAGHPDATADSLPEGWDWLVLPGFTHGKDGYTSRSLSVSAQRLRRLRSATAAAALEAMDPDLFIADRHPFGIDGELSSALGMMRAKGTRCILGLREVLDSPDTAAAEWERIGGAATVASAYDAVWIYGDRGIYDPLEHGEVPQQLAPLTTFTGYLSHGRPHDPASATGSTTRQPYVLSMVGGGSDGAALAEAAATARVPEGHRHLVLTGPQMPEDDHRRVCAAAEGREDITVARYAPEVPKLIRNAAAVVSMAGYNSVSEIMATTTPALLVPRSSRRAEQPRRAAALAEAGAVEHLPAQRLTPGALTVFFERAVKERTPRDAVDLDGLTRIGDLAAAQLMKGGRPFPSQAPADTTTELPSLTR